jgi:hypothetical protein
MCLRTTAARFIGLTLPQYGGAMVLFWRWRPKSNYAPRKGLEPVIGEHLSAFRFVAIASATHLHHHLHPFGIGFNVSYCP